MRKIFRFPYLHTNSAFKIKNLKFLFLKNVFHSYFPHYLNSAKKSEFTIILKLIFFITLFEKCTHWYLFYYFQTNRSHITYDTLSEQQRYEIRQQVRRYLEGHLDEIDVSCFFLCFKWFMLSLKINSDTVPMFKLEN